jgi:hypothetical protein
MVVLPLVSLMMRRIAGKKLETMAGIPAGLV